MAAVGSLGVSLPAPLERTVGLSRTADGRRRTECCDGVPACARGTATPFIGWVATLAVTLLAAFLRLWDLGKPRAFLFDETYYAKDAWSLLHHGYSQGYVEKANQQILDGHTTDLWTGAPNMVVHPELGKWLIALGENAFGMDPFGWRIASADRGRADGDGDDPARAPGHPLHDAGPGRGAADVLRRTAPGAVPAGPAGPVRRLLHALRRQLHGRRPRLGPRADGEGRADGHTARAGVVGAAAAVAAVAAGHGGVLGAGHRHEVVGAVPVGRLRPADVGLGLGRPPLLRRTRCGVEVSVDRRGARPGLRRAGAAADLRGHLDGMAAARGCLRAGPLRHPVRPLLGELPPGGCHGFLPRDVGVAALAVALPPRRLRLPHAASSTTASTSTSRTRGAGWC